ncbi:MAG: formate dehydrogenase accessory protein FdhE [Desulfobacterales bacterium]|jgi:FdhE protein
MTSNFDLTSDQVKRAVETVIKSKPVYTDMLGFYGRLFVAQEESKIRVRIDSLNIPENILAVKIREKMPLIEIEDFVYDKIECARLFVTIGKLAVAANPSMAVSAAAILDAVDAQLNPERLFSALLSGNEVLFENIAEEFEIEKQILGFITYNSLKPSLCKGAAQLSAYLPKDAPWLKGYCPICGSAPILSILESEGARSLICSFCWHSWSVKRVYCPFCENSENKELRYFFSEEEKEFRVYLCDQCNKYIKTIDTREVDRTIYPPLEQILTLHLDFKAREEGFEPGIKLFIQI